MAERDAKDYAIEHAGYLATAATEFLSALDEQWVKGEQLEGREDDEAEEARRDAAEHVSEARRSLRNCIYEFEKRRDRASIGDTPAPQSTEGGEALPQQHGSPDKFVSKDDMERAAGVGVPASAQVDELSALVRQLVHSLRKAAPGHTLPDRAVDYLKRHGLQGSPLRDGVALGESQQGGQSNG